MTREFAIGAMIALAAVVLLAMLIAWRARMRRDSALTAPLGVPEHAEVVDRHEVLYVSTTKHDQPLERLTISPLAYRARGEAAVTDRGLALCLDGAPTVFLASSRLVGVDRATVTIDKVVERDGLVRLVWLIAPGRPVDSYVRLQQTSPQELIAAIDSLIPAPASTGTEA